MRRITALILLALMTGCSKPAPAPLQPPLVAPPVTPVETPPVVESKPVPEVLAEPAPPDAVRRIAVENGAVVREEGAYFLNATSGAGEGWLFPKGSPYWGSDITDDNRFVTFAGEQHGYLVDRQSGAVWRWDPKQAYLVLASEHGFLFEEPGSHRFFWTGSDLKVRQKFQLNNTGWGRGAVLSPDGRRLALYRGELAIVDLQTGKVQQVEVPRFESVGSAAVETAGDQVQVALWVNKAGPQRPLWQEHIYRYDWSGQPVGALQIPGVYTFFSPDGKWVAWEEWPAGDLGPATVIANAATLKPHLTVLSTTPCFNAAGSAGTRWLSDSSGLVVSLNEGYRLLTLKGKLEQMAAFNNLWKEEPQPAPDHPDRFALGRRMVSNSAGAQQVGVTLEGFVTPTSLSPWGANSSELRFVVPPPPKGGACTEMRPPLPPLVLSAGQKLPEYPLVVAKGCAELQGAGPCLPAGTRLAPVRQRDDIPALDWRNQVWWVWAKTESGQTGWVSMAGDLISWANVDK